MRYMLDFAEWFLIMFGPFVNVLLGSMIAVSMIAGAAWALGRFLSARLP